MRRRLTVPIIGLLIASIVLFVVHPFGSSAADPRTGVVTRGEITAGIDLSGTIQAGSSRVAGFGTSGTVVNVEVAVGDTVRAGQQLAALDRSLLDAQLASATAALGGAQARLALDRAGGASSLSDPLVQARAALAAAQQAQQAAGAQNTAALSVAQAALDAARQRLAQDRRSGASADVVAADQATITLAQHAVDISKAQQAAASKLAATAVGSANKGIQGLAGGAGAGVSVSPANLKAAAVAQVATDQALVATAQLNVVVAQQAVDGAQLVAPIGGTVTNVGFRVGDRVAGGLPAVASVVPGMASTAAPGAITIQDLGHLQVAAQASEVDVVSLALGQDVDVSTDAVSASNVHGSVCQIDSVGQQTQGITSYGVTVCMASPNPAFRVGMTATASVVVAHRSGVLLVPNRAVRTIDGRSTVQVIDGAGAVIAEPVTIGLEGAEQTEVSGVREGDRVLLGDG